jgi:hypothetical protein
MREPMSPVVSSKKCGLIHERWEAILAGSEPGSIAAVGKDERPISTTRETVTGPSWIESIAHLAPRAGSCRTAGMPASSGRSVAAGKPARATASVA